MGIGDGLRLATGTLTIIPVGRIDPLPSKAGRTAMLAAPFVVIPVAAVVGGALWLTTLIGVPPLVAAGIALAAAAVLTRAMHLDGLADTVDGFGGGWTRERALEIMRRGDVGPMGVAGLILTLIAQAGAIAALVPLPWAGLLVATALCVSRTAATLLCATPVPPARETGMGAVMARSVPLPAAAILTVIVTAALSAAAAVAGIAWWWGAAATASAVLVTGLLAGAAIRKLGGMSGDVIGAGIEAALTVLLVVLTIGAAT